MLVEELASKLGLDLDVISFAKAILLAEGLMAGLEGILEIAKGAAKELVSFVTETAEHGTQLEEMSKRTGISTDRLQELQYAAQQTGTDLGVLVMGIRRLSISATEAAEGNGALGLVYRKLGVNVRDANGHVRDGDELLQDVAVSMSKMDNESEKARLSQQLFGRGLGQYLNPLMREGESSLAELTARFKEMQLAMSPEEIARAHEFTFAMNDFNLVMKRLKYSLGGSVLKPLTNLIRGAMSFVQVMRKAVHDNWDKYIERLKWALMGVGAIVLTMILPGMGAWIGSMITAIGLYVALSIQALMTGGEALAASLLPILGWLALAAVIVLVGEDLYQFFTGGDSLIGRFLSGPWGRLKWEFQDIWNTLKFYGGLAWDWLKDSAAKAVGWVVSEFQTIMESIKGFVEAVPGGKWVLEHAFGTGAQGPSAQAALAGGGAGAVSSNFQADITVHTAATDPAGTAGAVVGAFDDWHGDVLQDALYDGEEE